MKSKELKIYNIPKEDAPLLTMTIKPRKFLFVILWLSIILFCISPEYSVIGMVACAICLFALVAMPDRTLLDIYESLLVIYDSHQLDNCYCIYWDEVLTWQYARLQQGDRLRIELIDGQRIECDIYRSHKLMFYLHTLAKGKEKKMIRKRGRML